MWRLWWLLPLVALPIGAGLALQAVQGTETRADEAEHEVLALRADLGQAAAGLGWGVLTHAPAPSLEAVLGTLQGQAEAALAAAAPSRVDPPLAQAIATSMRSFLTDVRAQVGDASAVTPQAGAALRQEHQALAAQVDRYSGELGAAVASAGNVQVVGTWAAILGESALLAGALWYALTLRRRGEVSAVRRNTRRRLEAVVDHAPVVAFATDNGGVLRFCRGRALEVAGIDPETLLGRPMLEMFAGDPAVMSAALTSLGGEGVHVELPIYDRVWDVHAELATVDGGTPEVVGVATDVTELVASREALAAQDAELRAAHRAAEETLTLLETLQATAPVGFAFVDREFRFVRINDTLAAVNGLPVAACLGRRIEDLVPKLWPTLEPIYRGVLDGGEAVMNVEVAWDTPADPGRVHHSLNSYYPVRVDGNVVGVGILLVDITERKEAEQRLAAAVQAVDDSEERFRELVQHSSDIISLFDTDGRRIYSSPAAAALYGGAVDDVPVSALLKRVHRDDRRRVAAAMEDIASRPGATATLRFRLFDAADQLRDIESTVRNAVDHPVVRGIVVNTRDVTETARAQSLLATQARILTMIASGASLEDTLNAIAVEVKERMPRARCTIQLLTPEGTLAVAGAESRDGLACAHMAGLPVDARHTICGAAVGRHTEMLVDAPAGDAMWRGAACLAGPDAPEACWVTPVRHDPGGSPVGVIACYFPEPFEPDESARQIVATAGELVSLALDRRRFEDQLSHQSLHDPLTGLPNRALLMERLRGDVVRAGRAETTGAVLFIDLDRLKIINDSLGHESGDYVLREVARRLTATVRSEDTVARFGGDQFVVSSPQIHDDQEAIRLAERLLETVGRPMSVRSQDLRVTASIGIAYRRPSDRNVELLMRNADTAMYRAKERGRDRWELFDTGLRRRAMLRLRTESALRRAVDDNQLCVWYQPIWSVRERRIVDVEALVRWPRANGTIVPPSQFIPVAEETGLISRLGAQVLARASRDIAAIGADESMPRLRLSVNASVRQLVDGTLVPAVIRALEEGGLGPGRLIIEMTEGALLADTQRAVQTVDRLQELGVGIALDDFGTGFSSLSFVKKFPYIETIKIDRSFVSGGRDANRVDRAIVRAAIALADAGGAHVVAEGVETAEQLAALIDLGIDGIQGYLVSPPLPFADLRVALARQPWMADLARRGVDAVPRLHVTGAA